MLYIPKKTINQIIDTQNHYVAQVKGNQKNLLKDIKCCMEYQTDLDNFIVQEKGHGRHSKWTTTVFDASQSSKTKVWKNLRRYIHVHRQHKIKGKDVIQDAYFMSDLELSAQEFHQGIRLHWGIENKLHWVKDVVHKEDDNHITKGNAPVNVSIFRTIALNIHRKKVGHSITENQILFHANVKELFYFIRT
jgi:predicted transposase YbfD/YdcC